MTKKNILLATTGLLSLGLLFAFKYPESVRDNVLTLFFPVEKPALAPLYAPAATNTDTPEPVVKLAPFAHSLAQDTVGPLQERFGDFINNPNPNPVDLKDPKVVEQKVEYDPTSGMYIVTEKIGEDFYRAPTYMTFEEYLKWRDKKQQQEYFDRLQGVADGGKSRTGLVDPIAKFDIKNSLVERLFGGTNVDIRPQGNINLTFGYNYERRENPQLTLRQQRVGNFAFDMDINMSATGKIGEKLNLNFNYNTQATFDFDNQMKLNYDTKGFSEDEIIQNIEAGNVSMPLRSNLIRGAQNLFGLKTEMKFGHLRTTLLAAQQRSRQNSLKVQGGAQVQQFEVPIDEYDENRHFFLSHWNRSQFEPALKCLPVPQSLFTITRMEVWLTNDKLETTNFREIVALTDLGEPEPMLDGSDPLNPSNPNYPNYKYPVPPQRDINGKGLPANENNDLYPQITTAYAADSAFRFSDQIVRRLTQPQYNGFRLKQIQDFEKVRARLLSTSEYTYNDQLGFISINLNVQPDQVVGVAVEYTYNGIPHKIGEFSSDVSFGDTLNQNVLFVKMLKSTTANVRFPIWDLMMKNVYAVGAANVDPNEFRFDIFYEDPGKGQKRFLDGDQIPQGIKSKPLLQVFNLDNLNLQSDPGADGIFDFVPGLTINLRSGRVMLPVLEPFGQYLSDQLKAAGADTNVIKRYVYPQLYDSTLFRAREFQQLNRFSLRGSYKSSSSAEINLGTFNLPRGSVRVTGPGGPLIENKDYEIDYNIGKVRILNDAILQSGQSVNVSFEDNTLFGFQNRTMLGARFDYEWSKDLTIGATFMNLFERPLTQKVNFGDDPINNKMYGLDFNISKDAPWLTKLVDKLPFIETKEPSSIAAQAEVAVLQPGHNRAINQGEDKGGVVYIDDFEGSTANLPLTFPANGWTIASVPQGDSDLFPESDSTFGNSLLLGANRSRLAWYISDPGARDGQDIDDPYTRLIQYQDLFPNRQLTPLEQSALRPLDVTIFPRERGPYNYELPNGYPGFSAGLTSEGKLNLPETRWGGFMREISNNDFEAANIEFIEFWMLNPYMDKKDDPSNVSDDGDMYLDLGTLSEDIMRDSRQFFENAIPTGPGTGATVNTVWGRVPVLAPVVNAFDNDPAKRALQDVGFDGLTDTQEQSFFASWLAQISASSLLGSAKDSIFADPSNDNFVFFRDPIFEQDPDNPPGLLERYRKFNNSQGNSPVNNTTNLNPSATNYPDREDLNRDNSLNETEAYFRYKIPLRKTVDAGQEVLDLNDPALAELVTDTKVFDKDGRTYVWYRFKLPLDWKQRKQINGIQDFRSIRFLRMFWKGFTERTTFRFATLELGRNQWRRFNQVVNCSPSDQTRPRDGVSFDINAVSIEENAARTPFNYTIPFGIQREQSVGAFPDVLQNEQALALTVCNLPNCEGRAIFKVLNMDLRQYERMKMFVHAEPRQDANLQAGDLKVFMRLGSDFFNNYYEYEIPLTPSSPTAPPIVTGNPDSREYKEEVWRPENNFDFPLDLLTDVKKQRNADDSWQVGIPFVIPDPAKPANNVKVVGNPNLGYVKGIMVGVVNVDPNTGEQHCVELWINELRLNGFNEQGGFAGLARVDMKMADFGNLSLAGNYSSIGWGSIEQKLIQRQREEVIQVDMATNLELGKLLPEKSGVKVPFYAQYSNTTRNPEYDPYDLDIKLKDKLRDETDPAKREEIRVAAQDVNTVRGYNFTNVRKERVGKPRKIPLPWNIENFSLTYARNQQKKRTPFIINDELNQYKGSLDWQYSTGIKPIQPFKKLIKKDKFLKFITEFNFNPLPNTYGFSTNLERISQVTTWRFSGDDPARNTYYNRRFTWDRTYDLGWDIAKNSLRFNFDATARSLIDEPLQTKADGTVVSPKERRDSIWTNMRNLGRPKNYTHNASLTYTLPFKTIPFMDWITMKASYTAGYTWTAQSLKLQYLQTDFARFNNSRNLGNTIQNNAVRQINGEFKFDALYNKSKYLAKINKPAKPKGKGKNNGNKRDNAGDDGSGGLNPDDPSGGGRVGGADPKSNSRDSKSLPTDPTRDPRVNRDDKSAGGADPTGRAAAAGKAGANKGKDDKKKKDREPSLAERIAIRPLMMLRTARFNYSENYSTVVPGFTPDTKLMGLSEGFKAPGWAFVAGFQPGTDWLDEAGRNGWITQRPELNQQVTRNYSQTFDATATVEPFTDFRIELSANRQYTRNNTELFKDQNFNTDPDSVSFEHRAQRDLGSFTVSYFTLNTLFDSDIDGLFERYKNYRPIISTRLGQNAGNVDPHENDLGYRKGFGKIQQEVLIPSFVAAYTNSDPNTVDLNLFKTLPAVNWKLNYSGLSKVGNLKKIFNSIAFTHGYKSTLTVNAYNTDIFFDPDKPYDVVDPLNGNYIARYEIPQVVITENLQPLLGIDMKLKNEMTMKLEFKKSRTLSMSFIDYQLAESRATAYNIDLGYRRKNVNIAFLTGKKTKKTAKSKTKKPAPGAPAAPPTPAGAQQSNDMTFKFTFEYRDEITVNHSLAQRDQAIPTRGTRTIKISPSVDYSLNKRLSLRLFTDFNKTVPKTSQSFPITTINSGITVQFKLN